MMLDIISERNPALVKAAVQLHQSGEIPADCYVVDLDSVRQNVRSLRSYADELGLRLYAMTKQINRNPSMLKAIAGEGIDKFVAVDIEGAVTIDREGLDVAHVGHLSQIPKHAVQKVLKMEPDVWTVYGYDNARFVSEGAQALGVEQDLLLKIVGPDDHAYAAQEGGIPVEDSVEVARRVKDLPGVRIVGTTGFPCITYNLENNRLVAEPNIRTIVEAARAIEAELGIEMRQINCPGNSSRASMDIVKEYGGTDAEPGAAMWGMSPQQLFSDDTGIPAQVYVAEVSHYARDMVCVLGGGFYADSHDGPWEFKEGFVGSSPDTILDNRVKAGMPPAQWMDYYAWLYPEAGQDVRPGDSAVYFWRPQVFMTRSAHVATVTGVAENSPRVEAVYDKANRLVSD